MGLWLNGRRLIAVVGVVLFVGCAISPAAALPIGMFSWEQFEDIGPVFTVMNFSGAEFRGLVIELETEVDPYTLLLGDLISDTSIQTQDDLSGLQIQSAALSFDFDPPGVVAYPIVFAPDSFESIDYQPSGGSTSVPEPATWILVAIGIVGITAARGTRTALADSAPFPSPLDRS
jgi:hypothetical protein